MGNKPLLKPKIDVVFHALFREETKHLAEALISDILGEPVKVKTLDKDKETSRQTEEEKFLWYWAKTYGRQMVRGDSYDKLHKTISIVILDHEIEELKGMEELDVKWQIRDSKTGKRILTNHLEIVIIEIPKAKRLYKENWKNRISQWMMFLDEPNEKEVFRIMGENKKIKEAVEELKIVSNDEELRRIAELREKAVKDEYATLALGVERRNSTRNSTRNSARERTAEYNRKREM